MSVKRPCKWSSRNCNYPETVLALGLFARIDYEHYSAASYVSISFSL